MESPDTPRTNSIASLRLQLLFLVSEAVMALVDMHLGVFMVGPFLDAEPKMHNKNLRFSKPNTQVNITIAFVQAMDETGLV